MPIAEALSRVTEIRAILHTELAPPPAAPAAGSAAAFAATLNPATAVSGGAATSNSTGEAIVAEARKYVGVPYVFGGESPKGFDCSGLVQYVLRDLGINVGRVVQDQAKAGTAVPSLSQAQPGDLLITKGSKHVVIYAGDGMVVHAPYPGRTVSYQKNWLKDSDLQTIRRVVPTQTAPAPAPAVAPAAAQSAQLQAMMSMLGMQGTGSTQSSLAAMMAQSQLGLFGS